jgi:hypothetical protein
MLKTNVKRLAVLATGVTTMVGATSADASPIIITPPNAAMYIFTLTGDMNATFQNATFQLDANPTPDFVENGSFTIWSVAFDQSPTGFANLGFYSTSNSGGFIISDPTALHSFGNFLGPQLYIGTETNPTFKTGTFALIDDQGAGSYTLNIASAIGAVPEPATWGMMILGMGAVGFAMRRRQRVRTSVRFT